MPIILRIVDAITMWITKHPKLTVGILLLVGALGSLLGIISLVVLNISWLVPVFELLAVIAGAFLSMTGLLLVGFITMAALVVAFFAKAVIDMGGFANFWKNVWKGIQNVFVIVWDTIVTTAAFAMNVLIRGFMIYIDLINLAIISMNELFGLSMKTIGC